MARAKISLPENLINEFCRKHHIRRLSLFGSVVRDDFEPSSDVDVLVEFDPGHVPGLEFFAMESELGGLLGHRVELHTPNFLSAEIRSKIMAEAEVHYVAP
jgi:predicted nucleotidyltransferase